MLADALGGTCGPQRPPEIGILDFTLTEQGKTDVIFAGMPETQKCLQWHSVQVAQPPEDTVVLASSDICRVQAMRIGNNAWSMQFHVEIEPDTVGNWAAVPEYHDALIEALGSDGYTTIKTAADTHMSAMLASSEMLYRNFMTAIRA